MEGYATDLGQTNVAGNLTVIDLPQVFNDTAGAPPDLSSNITHITNSSILGNPGGNEILNFVNNSVDYVLYAGGLLIQFFTLGFIFDSMDAVASSIGFSFPTNVIGMLKIGFGIAHVLFIAYIWTGRSFSSFA